MAKPTLYPNPRRNGVQSKKPVADPESQAVIQAIEKARIRGRNPGSTSPDLEALFAEAERGNARMNRGFDTAPSAGKIGGVADPRAREFPDISDLAQTMPTFHGATFRRNDPANVAIDAEAAKRGQRVDGAGPYAGGLAMGFGDSSADPRLANLRRASQEEAAARQAGDARFDEAVRNGPKTQTESYDQINERRSKAGLPPAQQPSESQTQMARQTANDNMAGVAEATNARGKAMQAQNAEAEVTYNRQREAQGLAKRLGVSPDQALLMMEAGLGGVASPSGGGDPAIRQNVQNSMLFGPDRAGAIAQGQQVNPLKQKEFDTNQRRQDAEAHVRIIQNEYQLAKSALEQQLNTATPEMRVKIQEQLVQLKQSSEARALEAMRGGIGLPPAALQPATGQPDRTAGPPSGMPPEALLPATPVRTVSALPGDSIGNQFPPAALQPARRGEPLAGTEIGAFPWAGTPDEVAAAKPGFKPNFNDLRAASKDTWATDSLGSLFGKAYDPSPWNDGVGGPQDGIPQPGEVGNDLDVRYYLGQTHTKPMLDEMLGFLKNTPVDLLTANRMLKNRFSRYGDDAIRWALAQHFNRPEWIKNKAVFDMHFAPNWEGANSPMLGSY